MFNLKDNVVVITGASSGLGRQMARGFAGQGASLVLLARRVERLEELKGELGKEGVEVLPVKCDVTSTSDIENAVALTKEKFGKVDVLVNCAGASKDKGVLDMDDDEWDFTINTDLTSVFKMTRAFGNVMKENNYGRIINIASMYGMVGNSEIPTIAYHASKGGVVNFTRAAAAELAFGQPLPAEHPWQRPIACHQSGQGHRPAPKAHRGIPPLRPQGAAPDTADLRCRHCGNGSPEGWFLFWRPPA